LTPIHEAGILVTSDTLAIGRRPVKGRPSKKGSTGAWPREAVVFAAVVMITTVLFWATDLDIRVSELFYSPNHPQGPWPHYERTIWRVLYASDDYLTASLAVIALSLLLVGALKRGSRSLVRYGLFIALSGLIGAGLLTNMIFKEYWGHPRPDNITQFGGELEYLPPLAKGPAGNGESFPSGHVSISFSFIAFWFLLRRDWPRAAALCLIAVLSLTALEGIGRIVRGRHFLSDVLWGAYIPYAVCLALYHFIFRLPPHPKRGHNTIFIK
jgi:lipid A 4'-phosphatase